jgi:hypothetical protein
MNNYAGILKEHKSRKYNQLLKRSIYISLLYSDREKAAFSWQDFLKLNNVY